MLKNQELENIKHIQTLLSIIKEYTLEDNDFYNFTKITTKDIDKSIKSLNEICVKTITQKKIQSKKSNLWNKTHAERHNEINKKSYQKIKNNKEKII
jgi:hypothetical protein